MYLIRRGLFDGYLHHPFLTNFGKAITAKLIMLIEICRLLALIHPPLLLLTNLFLTTGNLLLWLIFRLDYIKNPVSALAEAGFFCLWTIYIRRYKFYLYNHFLPLTIKYRVILEISIIRIIALNTANAIKKEYGNHTPIIL